jgi:MtaA/CmuA family methyltransferase
LRELTPRKRVISAILGGRVDRIPVTAVNQTATHEQMEKVGASWPEAHYDAEKMAALACAAYPLTGLETARVPFDQAVEAEALGCRMEIKGEIPAITGHLKDYSDLSIPENFLERGRVPIVLDAVERVQSSVGDELPVMAGVVGPFSVAAQVFEPSEVLRWTMTKQEETREAISEIADPLIEYARELKNRGADIIVIEDMFSSQLGPRSFNAVAKDALEKLVSSTKCVNVLHICGNITKMVDDVLQVGPDGLSIGKETNLEATVKAAKGRTSIIGNIDPVRDLLLGSEEDVTKAVRGAMECGVDLIAPGCSIAPKTPTANLKRMVSSAIELSAKRRQLAPATAKVDFSLIFRKYGAPRKEALPYDSILPAEPELVRVARAVINGNPLEAEDAVKIALGKFDPLTVISEGLTKGMNVVSRMWDDGVYFLPEVVNSADAMQAGVKICEEKMGRAAERKGKIIAHVAEGDIHDIGKNIVVALLRANGFEVIDLGRDVPVRTVVETAKRERPIAIMGTALMTTTMTAFPRLAGELKREGLEILLACGGGAVNQEFVETFEGSAFGDKAADAVKIAELALQGLSWREIRGRVHK